MALCHIDVDVYQSARDTVEWVEPRLTSGGAIVFDPGPRAQEAVRALGARKIFCDYRPPDPAVGGGKISGIRASAHHYTTDEELRRFVEELAREVR